MSNQGYYGGDQSYQGSHQQQYGYSDGQAQRSHEYGGGQQQHQQPNPYGYPESGAPQPYYGQGQQGGYDYNQQQGYQNQPPSGYGAPPHQSQQPPYNYPPQSQGYQQYPPSHDQYPNAGGYDASRQHGYDTSRQQGYNQQPPPPQGYNQGPIAVPPQEIRADPNAPLPPGAEGERGLMGALAGGALGAYGGHQMGHGVIGALGGAYAGHKLEDTLKDKSKKKKKHHDGSVSRDDRRRHREERRDRRRQRGRRGSDSDSSSSSSSSSSDSDSDHGKKHRKHHSKSHAYGGYSSRDGAYAGNFSGSATNITLDRDYDLIALCAGRGGKEKLSSIDLNEYLSNEWGEFRWKRGGNAFASAREVRLVEGGRVLEAELGDGRGGWKRSRVVLDEKIGNDNGELVFVD